MDSLLDTLRDLPGSAPIFVKPFLGNAHVVGAFWDASGRLLGCITGPSNSPDDLLDDCNTDFE